MRFERSAGGRSRQSRSQQASHDAEVACGTMGLGQRFGVGDDHRNFVPRRVDSFVPFDVVEAWEPNLCEPVMDSGGGLVPTLLDDVEKDLAVLCTEISATLPASSGSVPNDFRSGNRFVALVHRDGEANISQQEFMSGKRRRVRRRVVHIDSDFPHE